MVLNSFEKRLHLRRLVDNVVGEEEATRVEPRVDDVEEAFVVRLPRVEEHQIEAALKLWNLLERVAVNDAHDVCQSCLLNVCSRFLCALRIVLNRDYVPPRFTSAEAQPDSAVAAGRTDLEHRLRSARRDQHAQESAVFLGHRELSLVGGLDVFEDRLDLRG